MPNLEVDAWITVVVSFKIENKIAILHFPSQEVIGKGLAFHHAGLSFNDRRVIEQLFLEGFLPILVSTSTLGMYTVKHLSSPCTLYLTSWRIALGVNLPAHLVIIKSTTQMIAGTEGREYSAAQILQMIGRAGRPQFDQTATAVVMTKSNLKVKQKSAIFLLLHTIDGYYCF